MGISGFMTFPMGIYPKENIIVRLEFALAYFEPAVKHFSRQLRKVYFAQRLFGGLSGIRAGRSMSNGRLEVERPQALAVPPSCGRAATWSPLNCT